jgi:probable phosphomutase (TIGR03848 family)
MALRRARRRSSLVIFVRHGQTPTTGKILPGQAPGLALSDEGRKQAEAAATRIAALPGIAAVYASPLERARETAAPIARALEIAVRIERGLSDIDVGDWTGQSLRRVSRRHEWSIVQRYPSGFRFPGGESFVEMEARVVGTVQQIVARHPRQTVVVVSHADPIKIAVAHALGMSLDLFQRLAIHPASISAIAYSATSPTVLTVNSMTGALAAIAS